MNDRADARPPIAYHMRVVFVDSQPVIRAGLVAQAALESDLTCVGEADNLQASIQLIETERPDIVVTELDFPDRIGPVVLESLQKVHPIDRIVVFASSCRLALVQAARQAGALGYISKQAPVSVLFMAVRRVFDGQAFFCDRALARLRRERLAAHGYHGNGASFANLSARLTPREATIAGYLAQGLSVRATAWALDLSPKTVDTHKTNLMTKLGVHDRIGLYRFALAEGLVAVSKS